MLCCAPPIFASARDFEAFVNLTQTTGPRSMPSPAECREWVRLPVSLSETASWTVVACPSKTGCWHVERVSPCQYNGLHSMRAYACAREHLLPYRQVMAC